MLARLARVRTSKVRPMLQEAKLLGFVTESVKDRFELLTLPPVSLDSLPFEPLKALGAPLFHGNRYRRPRSAAADIELHALTYKLYDRWRSRFRYNNHRKYVPEREDEVSRLKNLVRLVGEPEKVERMIDLFIDESRTLKLHEHQSYLRHGPTLTTFCALYPTLVRKLERQGFVIPRLRT